MSLSQNEISRRFHVEFKIRGNPEKLNYDLPFDDPNSEERIRFPESAESALQMFHVYMQRSRKMPWDSYVVTGLYDTYVDMFRNKVRRDFEITEASNPDVSLKKREKPTEPDAMFDMEAVKESSLEARDKFNNSTVTT